MAAAVTATGWSLAGVVNSAGVTSRIPLERLTDAEWDRVFAVNVTAAFRLTHLLAMDLIASGIRVNAVCPRTIPPPGLPAADLDRRLRHQAIERPGNPDDVAQAVAYLAGPAASFITGQALVVDGGVLCHLPSYADGGHLQASG